MRLIVEEIDEKVSVFVSFKDNAEQQRHGNTTGFQVPLTLVDLDDLRFYLEDYLELPSGAYALRGEAVANERLAKWGEALFCEVFAHPSAGPERAAAYAMLQDAAARGETAEFAVASQNARFLSLPWELLKAPGEQKPLALSISGFDRTLPQQFDYFHFHDTTNVIRILMVIARPDGVHDIPFQSIARRLFGHVSDLGNNVIAEVLRPPTFAAFERRLQDAAEAGGPFHLIHFDGHGSFGEINQAPNEFFTQRAFKAPVRQGFLCFEPPRGTGAELVSAARFAAALKAGRTPCVVLNACRSGAFENMDDTVGPEATVATRLIQEGVTSVVAMSHSVYVVAASAFMATFYERLFAGHSVSHALNDARRALSLGANTLRPSIGGQKKPLQDWMVPVHYQRARIQFPNFGAPRASRLSAADIFSEFQTKMSDQRGGRPSDDLAPEDGIFLGRDAEFYRLERAVRHDQLCIIHGIGGTGKTELVKAFARWLQLSRGLDHPKFVFFETFEPGRPTFGLEQVIRPIFLLITNGNDTPRLENDTEEKREMFVIEFLRSRRCLLIWDNFETAASLPTEHQATQPLNSRERARLSRFLKRLKGGTSAVIITSRSEEEWLDSADDGQSLKLGDINRIELRGLSNEDALIYADYLLEGNADAQRSRLTGAAAFKDLITYLRGHPLCMKLSLRHLERMSPISVLAALRGEAASLPESPEAGKLEALNASIMYSIKHISEIHRQKLFILALAEDTVSLLSLEMMTEAVKRGQNNLIEVCKLPTRLTPDGSTDWDSLLRKAKECGLIEDIGGAIYRLHPALPATLTALWREAAGSEFPTEREMAEGAYLAGATLCAVFIAKKMDSESAEAAFSHARIQRRSLEALLGVALRRKAFINATVILGTLDIFWTAIGATAVALAWCERSLTTLGEERTSIIDSPSSYQNLWFEANSIIAKTYLNERDLQAAAQIYHTIIESASKVGTTESQKIMASAYNQLSVIQTDLQHLDIAEELCVKSIALKTDDDTKSTAYHQLGNIYFYRSELESAEKWYNMELDIYKSNNDIRHIASTYHQLGHIAQRRRDFVSAKMLYGQSLIVHNKLDNKQGSAMNYVELGSISLLTGELDESEYWCKKGLAIIDLINDDINRAKAYNLLGNVALKRKDLPLAERWFTLSLQIDERLGDALGIAISYYTLATVMYSRGNLDASANLCIKSIEMYKKVKNPRGIAQNYYQLGRIEIDRGNTHESEACYKEAFNIAQQLSDRSLLAEVSAELGEISDRSGEINSALDYCVLSVALFPPLQKHPAPKALLNLARLFDKHGEAKLAESWQRVTSNELPDVIKDCLTFMIELDKQHQEGSRGELLDEE